MLRVFMYVNEIETERETETGREKERRYKYLLYDKRSYFLNDEINTSFLGFLFVWNF